jgi:hypothetical protein
MAAFIPMDEAVLLSLSINMLELGHELGSKIDG